MPVIRMFRAPESDARTIIGILLEGETTVDLTNLPESRKSPQRWNARPITMASLQRIIGRDGVHMFAFSPRALAYVLSGEYRGIARIPEVLAAARERKRVLDERACGTVEPTVVVSRESDRTVIRTQTSIDAATHTTKHPARPRVFPTR